MAPMAGAKTPGNTKISGQRPHGTPAYNGQHHPIHIEEAADIEPASLVWWGVMFIGLICFAAGLGIGYLLGAS